MLNIPFFCARVEYSLPSHACTCVRAPQTMLLRRVEKRELGDSRDAEGGAWTGLLNEVRRSLRAYAFGLGTLCS